MAGDWIPWQKGLSKKTEVLSISRLTGKDRRWIATALMEFWEWCDGESLDGLFAGLSLADLPALFDGTDMVFWQAVLSVDWLRVLPSGLSVPNFQRWLGHSAKRRLVNARRQHRKRIKDEMSRPERDKNGTPVLFSSRDPPISSQTGKRGGDAGGEKPSGLPEGFAEFWSAYPRKQAKKAALKAWKALSPAPDLRKTMLSALERQKRSEQWQQGFVPHAATWLNGRRWEDEECATPTETGVERLKRLEKDLWQSKTHSSNGSNGTP